MIGPGVDERDLRLAVRMVREHHEHIVNSREYDEMSVPWGQTAHINPVFVLSPVRTEWDYIEQIFENVPLTTYHRLADDGILSMLDEIRDFQNDPNSPYQYTGMMADYCQTCAMLARDDDHGLIEGPIGLQRWQARNATMPGRATMRDLHGRPTGHGQSRYVPHMYDPNP